MYLKCRIAFAAAVILLIILLSMLIFEPLAERATARKMKKFNILTLEEVYNITYTPTASTKTEIDPDQEFYRQFILDSLTQEETEL